MPISGDMAICVNDDDDNDDATSYFTSCTCARDIYTVYMWIV